MPVIVRFAPTQSAKANLIRASAMQVGEAARPIFGDWPIYIRDTNSRFIVLSNNVQPYVVDTASISGLDLIRITATLTIENVEIAK